MNVQHANLNRPRPWRPAPLTTEQLQQAMQPAYPSQGRLGRAGGR
ncbi:hypothetical protein [Actinoplanes sp. URMC 104]